jgi:hypothetical protein
MAYLKPYRTAAACTEQSHIRTIPNSNLLFVIALEAKRGALPDASPDFAAIVHNSDLARSKKVSNSCDRFLLSVRI